jgi:hypothetical protein
MKAFIVCLYDWDYNCDEDSLKTILAVYDTLEKAVHYSSSYHLKTSDKSIEIHEFQSEKQICTYQRDGSIFI